MPATAEEVSAYHLKQRGLAPVRGFVVLDHAPAFRLLAYDAAFAVAIESARVERDVGTAHHLAPHHGRRKQLGRARVAVLARRHDRLIDSAAQKRLV